MFGNEELLEMLTSLKVVEHSQIIKELDSYIATFKPSISCLVDKFKDENKMTSAIDLLGKKIKPFETNLVDTEVAEIRVYGYCVDDILTRKALRPGIEDFISKELSGPVKRIAENRINKYLPISDPRNEVRSEDVEIEGFSEEPAAQQQAWCTIL